MKPTASLLSLVALISLTPILVLGDTITLKNNLNYNGKVTFQNNEFLLRLDGRARVVHFLPTEVKTVRFNDEYANSEVPEIGGVRKGESGPGGPPRCEVNLIDGSRPFRGMLSAIGDNVVVVGGKRFPKPQIADLRILSAN